MNKADVGPGQLFPGFEKWLSELDSIDLSDENMALAIKEEAADGFFLRGIQQQEAIQNKRTIE
ncbi:hypothetical protein [Syntrophomonas curvata]